MRLQPVPVRHFTGSVSRYHGAPGRPAGREKRTAAERERWIRPRPPHRVSRQMVRVWSTSTCICSIRASMDSKRSVPRSRTAKSIAACSPYRSRSVRSRAYASTVRTWPSNVGLVPIEIAAGHRLTSCPASSRVASQPA